MPPDRAVYRIKPEEIIRAVPGVQSVTLPNTWSPDLEIKKSIFNQFYEYIVAERLCSEIDFRLLHNRTYIGDRLYKRLLTLERKRLSKYVKASDMENAMFWSDLGSGPQTGVLGKIAIVGDIALIIPDEGRDALAKIGLEVLERQRLKNVEVIKKRAAGPSYWHWLKSQDGRDDPVGDLISEVMRDEDFPVDAVDYFTVDRYLGSEAGHSNLGLAVRESWMEYLTQYPERGTKRIPCSLCEKFVSIDDCELVYDRSESALLVLDKSCSEPLQNHEDCTLIASGRVGRKEIEHVEDHCETISRREIEELEDRLILCGLARAQDTGWVYFIQSADSREVMIGFTTRDVESRVREMQTGHPSEILILAKTRGPVTLERELHKKFEKHSRRGEWFLPHPDLMSYITAISATKNASGTPS